ncbi:MAG: hypothetical protein ABSG42_06915 [Nitrospirota bacterium]
MLNNHITLHAEDELRTKGNEHLQRACDIGKSRKLDLVLRRYTLISASVCGLLSLVAGFYLGFGMVTGEPAANSPLFEKLFLNTFISISCGAAGMILGALIGSVIYRFKEKSRKTGS